MALIEDAIDVEVPIHSVYGQWTQFEDFPRFMQGVKAVRQLDDKRLHWRADIAGREVEWTAEITRQELDERIDWRSTGGVTNTGSITFARIVPARPLAPERTRVTLRLHYYPEGAVQATASAVGLVRARVRGDLERFKEFIEARGRETGAWRGEIHGPRVEPRARADRAEDRA